MNKYPSKLKIGDSEFRDNRNYTLIKNTPSRIVIEGELWRQTITRSNEVLKYNIYTNVSEHNENSGFFGHYSYIKYKRPINVE